MQGRVTGSKIKVTGSKVNVKVMGSKVKVKVTGSKVKVHGYYWLVMFNFNVHT